MVHLKIPAHRARFEGESGRPDAELSVKSTKLYREVEIDLRTRPGLCNFDRMSSTEYAHPEALVSTEWVAEHLNDPKVRIIESNEDVLLYDTGHIPGAVHVDWRRDLNDQTVRDYVDPKGFAELASRIGITPETTLVFYGDKSNWWACYALWVFTLFGHKDLRIANGGRDKWVAEKRELTREVPKYAPTQYPVPAGRADDKIRAFYEETLGAKQGGQAADRRTFPR